MRLIDAERVIDALMMDGLLPVEDKEAFEIIDFINCIDTVDAVEVVRCDECKHCFMEIVGGKKVYTCLYRLGTLDLDGYCEMGERKTE